MTADQLIIMLGVVQIDDDVFQGFNPENVNHLYGGHVMAQAVVAATKTIDQQRGLHSLHSYFVRKGDIKEPIRYEVERIRDGRSFSVRRVVAVQHGKAIYDCSLSYHVKEEGVSHQASIPANIVSPEDLPTLASLMGSANAGMLNVVIQAFIESWDFRLALTPGSFGGENTAQPATFNLWLRLKNRNSNHKLSIEQHKQLLAYASDYGLQLGTIIHHGIFPHTHHLQVASLDHSLWFHTNNERLDTNQWICHSMSNQWAGEARGLSFGRLYTQDGLLLASSSQEFLLRSRKK